MLSFLLRGKTVRHDRLFGNSIADNYSIISDLPIQTADYRITVLEF